MEEEVESSQPPVPPLPAVCVCERERKGRARESCLLCVKWMGNVLFNY